MRAASSAARREHDFYGIVKDQNGQTIPNVEIGYMMYPTPPRGYKGTGVVYSDSRGQFSIHGLVGYSVSFSPKREGYQSGGSGLGAEFGPGRYAADPANPQTLLLWKNKGAEELIAIEDGKFNAPLQGSVLIDLLTGRVVPSGGDLRVTFNCPPQPVAADGRRDWSCAIEAIEGGIRRAPNLETFDSILEAPAGDYTNQISFFMDKTKSSWHSGETFHVYLQSRNGRVFSKFLISVSTNPSDSAYISIWRGIANPNGSRNWEIDPLKLKHWETH